VFTARKRPARASKGVLRFEADQAQISDQFNQR